MIYCTKLYFRYKNFFNGRFPEDERKPPFYYDVVHKGDNNGLGPLGFYLEKIYTEPEWPPSTPTLPASLKATGKSRADLWALAGLVALERSIERANYACDHDKNVRQQITLLEGRHKCDIKLTSPVKFMTGRVDCIPDPEAGFPFIASRPEAQPSPFGNGDEVLAYMKTNFDMSARHTTALMAVHSAASMVSLNAIGLKYTWFGNGYLSSFYYKLLANRPIYAYGEAPLGIDQDVPGDNAVARGDAEGNPLSLTNWRVHCNRLWNTTDGGPCFVRPTMPTCPEDNPNAALLQDDCFDGFDEQGDRKVKDIECCEGVSFSEDGIQLGGSCGGAKTSCRFNVQFALPYELGLYNKLTYDSVTRRPLGCPGINIDREDFIGRRVCLNKTILGWNASFFLLFHQLYIINISIIYLQFSRYNNSLSIIGAPIKG